MNYLAGEKNACVFNNFVGLQECSYQQKDVLSRVLPFYTS